jgi:hypothetical protein
MGAPVPMVQAFQRQVLANDLDPLLFHCGLSLPITGSVNRFNVVALSLSRHDGFGKVCKAKNYKGFSLSNDRPCRCITMDG